MPGGIGREWCCGREFWATLGRQPQRLRVLLQEGVVMQDERLTDEPPALVELGEFNEDTLTFGPPSQDSLVLGMFG
jgi:hypothetical protein